MTTINLSIFHGRRVKSRAVKPPALWRCWLAAAALLLPAAASAQSVGFSIGFVETTSGTPVTFQVNTRDANSIPIGGGTFAWTLNCSNNLGALLVQPAAPDADGSTDATFRASGPDSCNVTVSWDPDGAAGPGSPVSPGEPLFIQIDPVLSATIQASPANSIHTSENPTFRVTILGDGSPISAATEWEIIGPGGMPDFRGGSCSRYLDPMTGEASLDFASEMIPVVPGSYVVNLRAYASSPCKGGKASSNKGSIIPPLATFGFTVSSFQIVFTAPALNANIPVNQATNVLFEVRDGAGVGQPGYDVNYSASDINGPIASGTATSGANGQISIPITPSAIGGVGINASLAIDPMVIGNHQLQAEPTYTFAVTQPAGGAITLPPNTPTTFIMTVDDSSGSPVGGHNINVTSSPTIAGLPSAIQTSNGSPDPLGQATLAFTTPGTRGTYTVTLEHTGPFFIPKGADAKATGITPLTEVVTLTVQNVLVANDDDFSATQINGPSGGSTASVYANDTYNGTSPMPDTAVTSTITSDGGLTGVGISPQGNLTVPAGRPGGSYTVTYQVCEVADPTNCASANALVAVRDPVRTIAKSGTDESPTYPSATGGLGVDVRDDGVGVVDTVVYTVVSGPVVLVDAMGADVGSSYSEPTSPSGLGGVNKRHTGPGLSVITAHRQADPSVSVTFNFETYQFLLSDGGSATTAVPGQPFNLVAFLQRQGAATAPASGASGAISFTQTGGPATVTPGATTDAGGGNYQSTVTFATPGTYTFEATFTDPNPPAGFQGAGQAQTVTVPYSITVGTAAMSMAVSANPTTLSAPGAISYTLSLSNTGSAPLASVVVNDVLPDGNSASLSGPSGDGGSPGILDAGETWTYTTQYQATAADINAGTPLVNTASASAVSGNLPVNSNTATATTTIVILKTLEAVSGDNQSAPVTTPLPLPLVVAARENGVAQAGVPVTWSVGAGAVLRTASGQVGSTVTTATDASGRVQVEVTLGPAAGSVSISAARDDAPGVSVGFVATAQDITPLRALTLPPDSGNGASATPGSILPLAVLATRDDQPEAGVTINWDVLGTNATASPTSSVTGADGIARTTIALATTAQGPVQIRATRANGGSNSVTYSLTAAGAATDALQAVSGARQIGTPGSTLDDLVVRYTRDGAPVAGQAVSWNVTSGDAVLVGPTSGTTASDGTASIGVRLGNGIGESIVTASSGTLSTTFVLTASAARAVNLRLVSGDQQRGAIGTLTAAPIVVQAFEIVDGAEQPVAAEIRWTIASGDATFETGGTTLRTATGADGGSAQRLRFGSTPGEVVVTVQVADTGQGIQARATSFLPSLRIISGDGQSAAPGTNLQAPLVVGIGDPGTAKALAGTLISWRVLSGGGQLGSATTPTDAQGTAQNTLRLGPQAGPNVVEAALADGTRVQFSASGAVAAGASLSIVSGDAQTLATNEPSAPLVVLLRDAGNAPIAGARIVWTGDNAEPQDAATFTGSNGQAQTTARLANAAGGRVTARVDGSNLSVAFVLNGGVVETSGLSEDQRRNAGLVDALCPALEALRASGAALSAGQADLLARCLELEESAGPRPQEVQEALTELVAQIASVLSDAALDTLRTQLGNHATRFDQLRNGKRSGLAQNLGIGVWTPDGLVSLSLLPSSLTQAEGDGEGGGEVGAEFDRWGFFATGTIGRGESRPDSRTPEYDFDTSGLTAGVDYRFSDQLVGGVSLGYARHDTEMADERGELDTTGWTVSGYATWYNDKAWYVDGVLSYGSNSYDLLRRIRYDITALDGGRTFVDQVATAATDSTQLGGSISLGRDFQKGAWSLSSYLRGDYSRISFDGYTERAIAGSDGEGLVLTVDPRDLTSMAATLGGRATYVISRDWGILMPHVQLELQQEFKDDPQRLATRFTFDPTQTTALFEGQEVDSSLANLGLGLSALFPGGKSAYLYYERLMGSSQIKQDTLSLGVRIEF